MKTKTKRNYLLGIILSTFLIVGIINVTNGENNGEKTFIDTNPDISKLHTSSLFSLFLGNNSNNVEISVDTGGDNLNIRNGLIIGTNHIVSGSPKLSVIGGGKSNTMNGNYAGIGGGSKNIINYDNGVIGGGYNNRIEGPHGIIGGGENNRASNNGIILGGYKNVSNDYGIILGGKENTAIKNSLVLGSNAYGVGPYSFAWNGHAPANSACINTTGGMLIGTYNPISGVSLVVSGATKLSGNNNSHNTGGIFVNSTGCIQFYDGNVYNTLGKASENSEKCGINTGCQFGTTILHHGDIQTAYSASYAKDCQTVSGNVTCTNGKMVDSDGNSNKYIYPYCYNLSSDPRIDVESGYQNCTGLPENAEWVNPYFEQKLLNGNTYSVQPAATHISEGKSECTYKCISDEYQYKDGKCIKMGKCEGGEIPGNNTQKSDLVPTVDRLWQYVDPGTTLQACQWTCTGGLERSGNDCVEPTQNTVLITGYGVMMAMDRISGNKFNITEFKKYDENIPNGVNKLDISESGAPVYIWYDNGTIYYHSDATTIYMNPDSSHMFEGLNHLVDISGIYSLDTSLLTNMYNMFERCESLTNLDVSKFNTSNVTNMEGVFDGCYNLENLDVSKWDTSKVTTMQNMFRNCRKLKNIDVSNRNTQNVTMMTQVFGGCSNLESLDLSKWDTSKVKYMNAMFNSCSKLESLDLSNWNTSKVTTMQGMFSNCRNLTTIYASENFVASGVTDSSNMFYYTTKLQGGAGTTYSGSHVDKEYARLDCGPSAPGYFSSKTQYSCNNGEPTLDAAYLITGTDINNMMRDLTNLSNIQYFKMYAGNSIPSGVTTKIISTDEGKEVKMWYDNNKTIYYYTDASTIYMHSDSSRMFENLSNLKSLDFSQGNWNTSRVTNMEKMFWVCSNLQTIKFGSGWDTSKVGNMIQMFAQCESLESLDFSKGNWDTSNVTDMTQMFANCSNLQTINFGNKWNTSKVTDMTLMFGVCQSLKSLDFSQGNWDTSNVTGMDSMFYSCQELTSLDFSKGNWNTSKVTSMEKMFESCYKLEAINFGNKWDTSKVTDMTQMFANGYKLTTLDFSKGNWNTSKVKKMTSMFNGMGNLTTIYVSDNFKVDQVTNSSLMFYNDKKLKGKNGTQYDESHINKEYARIDCPNNPGYFSGHSNLCNNSTPDVAYLITGTDINNMMKNLTNVSNIKYFKMYAGNSIPSGVTTKIISTDEGKEVKMWYDNNGTIYYYTDASKIYLNQDSSHMFDGLEKVETIETLKWDTTRVVNMSYMFYNCKNLKNLDVQVSHGWYTDNVKDMTYMFQNCKNLTNLELSNWKTDEVESMKGMFYGCSSLTSLDLSNWNTRDVIRDGMTYMFYGCTNLQSIKFGENWNMVGYQSSVNSISSMFNGCSSLTSLDLSSWNTSEVIDMSSLFLGCTNLKNITFGDNRFTNKVKYMNHMFDGCSSLTNLDLSSWNTSQVKEMQYMFTGCSNLTNLDLSSWNTSQVTNITSMFENANNLKKIYASENFKVDHITNSSYSLNMFKNANSIKGGIGTTYNSSKIHKEYARLDCGSSNPGYFSKKDGDYSSCTNAVSLGANIKAPACTINGIRAIINGNTHSSTCVINPNTNDTCGFNGKLPPGTNYNNISIIHNNGTCTISNGGNVHVISENGWLGGEEPPHYNGYYRNCSCN